MKKNETVNGSSVRTPGDNRHNFAQVPAMTRPIPLPRMDMLQQREEVGKQIKTSLDQNDSLPSAKGIRE